MLRLNIVTKLLYCVLAMFFLSNQNILLGDEISEPQLPNRTTPADRDTGDDEEDEENEEDEEKIRTITTRGARKEVDLSEFEGITDLSEITVDMELKAEKSKEAILPWMPFVLEFTLINRENKEILIGEHDIVDRIRQFKAVRKGEVIYRGRPSRPSPSPIIQEIELFPYVFPKEDRVSFIEVFQSKWEIPPSQTPIEGPLFSAPGNYELKNLHVRLTGQDGGNQHIEADPINVPVILPEEYEEAFEALKKLSEPNILLEPEHVLYDPEIAVGDISLDDEESQELIQKWGGWDRELRNFLVDYGDTPWAALAWNARAWIEKKQRNEQEQEEFARNAVKMAEKHGIDHTRREAMEVRMKALRDLGEEERAQEIRDKLRKEKRERIERVPEEAEPEEPERDEHPLEARKRLERRIEKLEAEGYDPMSMRERAPEGWEEYFETREELRAQVREGELLRKDYYEKMASVLQRLTHEHLEPMEQDVLREQIEERERQREAQKRERKEERQKWREENPEEYIEMLRELQKDAEEQGMKMEIDEE